MPAPTPTAIRHALKRVEISRKQENLTDGEGRGTGSAAQPSAFTCITKSSRCTI